MSGRENIISDDDVEIVHISDEHEDVIKSFETDAEELKKFLVEDAIRNQKLLISNTSLLFYKPEGRVIAYITFLADAIEIQGTPLRSSFLKKGIRYSTMPALKIGRLCVDKNYECRGVGTKLIIFAFMQAIELNEIAACRFLTVDAKLETAADEFYERMGFIVLPRQPDVRNSGEETAFMYVDLLHVDKHIAKLSD